MTVVRVSYKELPPEVRKRSAAAAKARHRSVLGDPTATQEARQHAVRQLDHLNKWESGTLDK